MEENKNIEVKKTLDTEHEPPVSAREAWHIRNHNGGKSGSSDGYTDKSRNTAYYGSVPPRKNNVKPWFIFAGILIGIVLLALIFSVASDSGFFGDDDGSGASGVREDFIGVLYINGTIEEDGTEYNQGYVIDVIDGLIANSNNKGLILYVNTPGGGVYESDAVYLKIREYQNETKRPVYVYMASQATSGGYYISANADKIMANRNCWTGSIGVTLGTLYNISGLLDKYGIDTETITSGKNKAMGSMVDPLTAEQRKILQSLVDEAYDQFVQIVADGRNMDVNTVRKIADGRIYTAKQAKKLGLIDDVVTDFETVSDAMMDEYDLHDCELYDFEYVDESNFLSSFIESIDKLSEASSGNGDIDALVELMENDGELPLQYLCEVKK